MKLSGVKTGERRAERKAVEVIRFVLWLCFSPKKKNKQRRPVLFKVFVTELSVWFCIVYTLYLYCSVAVLLGSCDVVT